jgi:hypothetical protein
MVQLGRPQLNEGGLRAARQVEGYINVFLLR